MNINKKGFTLVELMVVVAIIGILSAIAIPNFNRYQRNAKKPEGKIFLSEAYQTEVIYKMSSGIYSQALARTSGQWGLGLNKQAKYYTYGFQGTDGDHHTVSSDGVTFDKFANPDDFVVIGGDSFLIGAVSSIGLLSGDPGNHGFSVDQDQIFMDSDTDTVLQFAP